MNSINIITPYRNPDSPETWVFDDDARGLLREPFVGEANPQAVDRLPSCSRGALRSGQF
jgi:hypothetical protein